MKEITAAYRSLALRWHPDRHPSDSAALAEAHFKEVSAAYRALRGEAGDGGDDEHATAAASSFAAAAGITRAEADQLLREADQLLREVFGEDTLSEIASVAERAEAFQRRSGREVLQLYPGAQSAVQQLCVGRAGAMVMRTTVLRGGRVETHERDMTAEELAELTELGTGVARVAGKAAQDVAAKVATEVGHGIARGLAGVVIGGLVKASEFAASALPGPSLIPGKPQKQPDK